MNIANRLEKLESTAAVQAGGQKANVGTCVPELKIIGEYLAEKRVDLWEWVGETAQRFWDKWCDAKQEPDAETLAEVRALYDQALRSMELPDPPGLKFYTLAGIVVDYAAHIVRQRIQDEERKELWKFANTDEWTPRETALRAKHEARKDPGVWNHADHEWRKDPLDEAVAREILFCSGWPGPTQPFNAPESASVSDGD